MIGAVTLVATIREHRAWFQTAADLSGLAIVQCALFYWFQVPSWRTSWRADAEQPQPRRDQFSIADIAVATTVVALLLALVIRYSPAIRPVTYWSVLAATWFGGAAITTCIAKAMTSKQILKAVALLSTGLVLAYVGTYAIAVADSIVNEGPFNANSVRMFASYYGQIVWGYLLTFVVFAALGRVSPS